MNSVTRLFNEYGITAKLDSSGRVWFGNVGKSLGAASGDDAAWQAIRLLMMDVEEHAVQYLMKDSRVIVKAQRQMVVLFPSEILKLLQTDSELYARSLQRGKSEKRIQTNERRRAMGEL